MSMQLTGWARAGAVAAVVSGFPSTLMTFAEGGDLLASTRAAGALVPGRHTPAGQLMAGGAAHVVLSLSWAAVLDRILPRPPRPWHGAVAGLAIAVIDLGIVGRRFPAIRSLPAGRQWADHVAYGVVVAASLAASNRARVFSTS